MNKNLHGRILKGEPKKQHLNTVLSFVVLDIFVYGKM